MSRRPRTELLYLDDFAFSEEYSLSQGQDLCELVSQRVRSAVGRDRRAAGVVLAHVHGLARV